MKVAIILLFAIAGAPSARSNNAQPPSSGDTMSASVNSSIKREYIVHPVLGSLDAYYVAGGLPYLVTGRVALGELPFKSVITIWTNPDSPSDVAMVGALKVVGADKALRSEIEKRLFENYTEVTRAEYLNYAKDPGYGIKPAMLPEIKSPQEVWTIFKPLAHCVSVSEPSKFYPSDVAELTFSFSVDFDKEHDFHIVFRAGKFYEITR